MVTIISSLFSDDAWHIFATIILPAATLTGPYVLDLPATATIPQLSAAILALYT